MIAGSRGEYGYYRPIVNEIKKMPELDYEFAVCNMHPLASFGNSVEEIENDDFKVGAVVYNTLDGYNRHTMAKSLGIFMVELPGIIERIRPDLILIAGDRGEQLMAAIVGAHMYIPVAHIQAGELSGNIDGTTRHAITKFSHIHFAANSDASERLKKMGEDEFRIYNVGAPQLDELITGVITSPEKIKEKFGVENKKFLLVAQHSVTEEFEKTEEHIAATMRAVSLSGLPAIIILNNSDAGSKIARSTIAKLRDSNMKIYANVSRNDYAGLMNTAAVLIGNSSSGIIEAPLFQLPTINIGNRQKGRMQSANVINVSHNAADIAQAIKTAQTPEFRRQADSAIGAYGDGRSAKRIVNVLKTIAIDDRLLIKKLTY